MIVIVPIVMIAGALLWALWPRKAPTHSRKTAIIATVIPPAAVSIAAIIIQAGHNIAGKEGYLIYQMLSLSPGWVLVEYY